MKTAHAESQRLLLVKVGSCRAGLPLDRVREITPTLDVEALSAAPVFVKGIAIIRSCPVPVLDLAMVLGLQEHAPPTRFVLLRIGDRSVAVAVASVIGTGRFEDQLLTQTPPLLRDAPGELVERMSELDGELLMMLRVGRLIPDELWDALVDQGPGI